MLGSFLPALVPFEVERAVLLIQQAYGPGHSSSEEQRTLQHDLFEIQKRPEAWGLVVPFLGNEDPNVQFFGAHTAQIKIARDWDTFPPESALQLRDLLLDLTGMSVTAGRSKVTLRKLFVAIASLALKLVPGSPSRWPDWILSSVTSLSSRGAPTEHILNFLAIVAEEVERSDLLAHSKAQMQQSLQDAVSMVVHTITQPITQPGVSTAELQSALKCLGAWLSVFPASDLTPLIPPLIQLLSSESTFILASDALQELMTRSSLSDGSGTKTLTEPVFAWLSQQGRTIVEQTVASGSVDDVSHSLCKLLVALGDHSINYIASTITSSLTQLFLKLLLVYTALPGWYGVDEEESEMTLGFWYLLQEALWSVDFVTDRVSSDQDQFTVTHIVYQELVTILKRKVTWPDRTKLAVWSTDDKEKFRVYRRDVGDTLINAYYILRESMLQDFVNDLAVKLNAPQQDWGDIEATLHCVMSIQEAVPLLSDPHISRLFGPEVLGQLPTTGRDRVRRTAVALIGAYASWFTTQTATQPQQPLLLLSAVGYVVSALSEPVLCLSAANALRDLCDANRTALAPHIAAFAELHASLPSIPHTEKSKVLQSIASVIQALPPEEGIPPAEAIVRPVVAKLVESLSLSVSLPEEARTLCIYQLQALSGCAKGLTGAMDLWVSIEQNPSQQEVDRMDRARADLRMVSLRESIISAIRGAVELWSTDASVGDALSDLFKSITSLPADATLLSLPPGPLLEFVCVAAQRQLTAVWLSLASMLILQLDPPSLFSLKSTPSDDSQALVLNVVSLLLQISLGVLGHAGAMEANPDIVQAFFSCMEMCAQHFIATFYHLPSGSFDGLMQCAISALSLQERYSLVAACSFLAFLFNRTLVNEELPEARELLVQTHGRNVMYAVLAGFAGVAPRSAMPNLIDLLSTMVSRCPQESRLWMPEILSSGAFVQSKAGPDTKEKFIKAVLSARSIKRTRDAAQQFSLIARGLEGSSFGYATVTM